MIRRVPGSDDGSASKILRSDCHQRSYLASDIEMTEKSLGGSQELDQRPPFNALLVLNEASTATSVNEPTARGSAGSGRTAQLSLNMRPLEWSESIDLPQSLPAYGFNY